jgi:hypothetical protein
VTLPPDPSPSDPPLPDAYQPDFGSEPAGKRGRRLSSALVPLLAVVVITALGWPIGWLWSALSPRVAALKIDNGVVYAVPEPEEAVAGDGWFLLIGLGVGIILALVAWLALRRWRGPWMLAALVVGSLAGAWVAWYTGTHVGYDAYLHWRDTGAVGSQWRIPLALRVTDLHKDSPWSVVGGNEPWLRVNGVLAAQALAAAFVYTCCAGWSRYASLRGPDPWQPHPWAYQASPGPHQHGPDHAGPDQFGPGRTGSSETGTGTALT